VFLYIAQSLHLDDTWKNGSPFINHFIVTTIIIVSIYISICLHFAVATPTVSLIITLLATIQSDKKPVTSALDEALQAQHEAEFCALSHRRLGVYLGLSAVFNIIYLLSASVLVFYLLRILE
jgi:hypothetical protein